MNLEGALSKLVLLAGLALLVGVGVLAFGVAGTWDTRNTDILVSSLATGCVGGLVAIAVILSVLLGVPLAIKLMREQGEQQRLSQNTLPGQWQALPPAHRPGLPGWAEQAPQLTGSSDAGQWHTLGPEQYDLWEGQESEVRDWRQG